MDRISKTSKTEVDLTKPLKVELANDESCYGKMYDPRTRECSLCHDNVTCGIHFQKNVIGNIRAREKKEKGFLDMQDFESIPLDKLSNVLQKANPAPVKSVLKVIQHYSKSKDSIACMRFLIEYCKANDFKIKENKVHVS